MEEKKFFDVFPLLELKNDLKMVFEDALVTHISMNSARTRVKIHLQFNRLIGRDVIAQLVKEMSRQVKPFFNMEIIILERFVLSSLHTPKTILENYRDSIIFELSQKNKLLEQIFKESVIEFMDDEHAGITMTDNFVVREKSGEIIGILKDMFNNRFCMDIDFDVIFEKREESRHSKEARYRVEKIVEEISNRVENNEKATVEENAAKVIEPEKKEKKEPAPRPEKEPSSDNRDYFRPVKKSDNPDVIYGRDFEDEVIRLDTVIQEMGEITFRGQIIATDKRELRNKKIIYIFDVTDFTDSITVKIFMRPEQLEQLGQELTKGKFIKIKGVTTIDRFSGELTIGSVSGIMKIGDFREKRMDMAMEKRVELHCHTKMSELDGVSDAGDIVKRAIEWGHDAIAITDHGVVQSFTEAYHKLQGMKNKTFKVIYGVEAYIVDDLDKIIVNSKGQSFDDTYVVFDLETTGLSPVSDRIIEIGAVKIKERKIVDRFSAFVNPQIPIPFNIQQLTGINDSMVENADTIETILPQFLEFCKDAVLVAHNAGFDVSFIKEKTRQILNREFNCTVADTVALSRALLPALAKFTLDNVAKSLSVKLKNHHRAVDDAECCADIFLVLIEKLIGREVYNLDKINEIKEFNVNAVKKAKSYHAIILANSEVGRVNLYRLVSMSHLTYYNKRPRIPKSEIEKYRDGLILGSACEAGELYQAILGNSTQEDIVRLVNYYDYLEIQPLGNNRFMIDSSKIPQIKSEADLIKINKQIVEIGEKFNKPVVATCDVHFLNPEDEVYRRIIMKGQGFDDADNHFFSGLRRKCLQSFHIWVRKKRMKLLSPTQG